MGPNLKKLVAHKMSYDAIPAGGGLADAMAFVTDPEALVSGARRAQEWVQLAIKAVRTAAEPNPWKNADDETIAEEILKQLEAKLKKHSGL